MNRGPISDRGCPDGSIFETADGFTLVELAVVVAAISVLVVLAAPAAFSMIERGKIVHAHSDLRQIGIALELFRNENDREYPPTRFSCSTRTEFELPAELSPYLPTREDRGVIRIAMGDPFDSSRSYFYRAPGVAIANETTRIANGSRLWVPDGIPIQEEVAGKYYTDPKESPVLYAIWSEGPDPATSKFDVPGRRPVPSRYWMNGPGDTGVIVHYMNASGQQTISN